MSSWKLLSCKLYMSPFILIIAVITPSYRRPKNSTQRKPQPDGEVGLLNTLVVKNWTGFKGWQLSTADHTPALTRRSRSDDWRWSMVEIICKTATQVVDHNRVCWQYSAEWSSRLLTRHPTNAVDHLDVLTANLFYPRDGGEWKCETWKCK